MIARLLDPLLNLHGWEAYTLVGALVFAEASILIGFVFPGETAVIIGGVAASRDHINIAILIVVVVTCAIAGDSVGYLVGEKWGRRLLETRLLRKRQRMLAAVLVQLNRRGAVAVFVARFTAFLRAAVPGLAGMSSMPYRVFLPPTRPAVSCGERPSVSWATSWATPTPGRSTTRASRPTSFSVSSRSSSSCRRSAGGGGRKPNRTAGPRSFRGTQARAAGVALSRKS